MNRLYQTDTTASTVDLYLGDCLQVLKTLDKKKISAIVSDPPYGRRHLSKCKRRADHSRFSKGNRVAARKDRDEIIGDDRPFDPAPWLDFPKVILFGMNCYSDRLPCGTALVWCKRSPAKIGKFLSDCEIAWMKGGYGVYLFNHVWDGVCRDSEVGQFLHPAQKPVALMKWCIGRLRLEPGATILDPYMGAGATGVAAVEMGFHFVGIEQDPTYFKIARDRIAAANSAVPLFA